MRRTTHKAKEARAVQRAVERSGASHLLASLGVDASRVLYASTIQKEYIYESSHDETQETLSE